MYGRICSITAQAAGGQSIDVSQLRCRFKIKQHSIHAPSTATIRITNQNPDIAQMFVTPNAEFTTVTIMAGYEDEGTSGILFSGNILQAFYGRENPTDTMTTILAADNHQGHNYGVVNQTFPAGSTPMDHYNAAVQAMSQYGASPGFIGPSLNGLSTPSYPRAVPLYGMARKVLADIARSNNAQVFYTNGQVNMLGPSDNMPGGTVVLNSQTGLIGMPTQEIGGVMARSLINTNIKVGGQIQIEQSDIQQFLQSAGPSGGLNVPDVNLAQLAADGIYTVYQIDIDGDTRGNPWYMDIAALVPGQTTSQSIAAAADPTAPSAAAPASPAPDTTPSGVGHQ